MKCPPEIGPKTVIRTTRIAPVARVLPSSATASLPLARFSPMMPEPITVASSSSVPRASARSLRDIPGIAASTVSKQSGPVYVAGTTDA